MEIVAHVIERHQHDHETAQHVDVGHAQRGRTAIRLPRPPGCEKLSGQERYRVRQGVYRIVYEVEGSRLVVLVVKIGHRRDVDRG